MVRPDPTDLDLTDLDLIDLDPTGLDPTGLGPAEYDPTDGEANAWGHRFVLHMCETALRAAALITLGRTPARPGEGTGAPAFASVDEARGWMRSHTESLTHCVAWARSRGMHETVCRLVESVEAHLRESGEFHGLLELLRAGLDSSRALGDAVWQVRMHNMLGLALMGAVRLDEAEGQFTVAQALAESDGDNRGLAVALECRGLVAQEQGRDEDALVLFERTRPLQVAMGPHAVATLDVLVGRSLVNLGRFDHALEALAAALEVFVASGEGRPVDEVNVAKVRQERGRVLVAKRRWLEARKELELALTGFSARGLVYQMAQVRVAMAGHAQLTGQQDWQNHLVEAERLYRETGNDAKAARLRTYLR